MKKSYLMLLSFPLMIALTACDLLGDKANSPKSVTPVAKSNPQADPSPVELKNENPCYRDLCSSESAWMEKRINEAKTGTEDQQKYYDQNFSNEMRKTISLWKYKEQIVGERILQNRNKFPEIQLNASQLRLLQFSVFQKRKSKLQKAAVDEFESKIKYLRSVQISTWLETMKLDEFVKKVYPGATIKEAITKFLPISQNNAKKINDALLFEGVELNSLVKNKIDKGQDLNSSEILDFFKYYTNTEIIRDLLFGEMGDLFQKLNVDISELLTQIPTEQEIREMQKSDLTEESLNQRCRTGFLFNLNMSPTEEEIKAASAVADTLKIAAKSLSNQVEAQKHIDELKFVFPTSYSVYPKEFEQNLSLLRHEYESMVQSADKMSLEILKVMYIFGKNSASQKSTNPCRTLFPILDDRTDATSGAVVLGKMTVKLIGYGKGIMAHEIGHNLFFDETVLPEFRKCDISKHGTEKYLSEDFADRAAISILKKAGLENSPNFGCLLTYYSSDRDLKPNQEEGDKHSPSLLRTLAIAQAKGQVIPESCQSQAKKEFSNAMISCQ